jgi:hypothetical protein
MRDQAPEVRALYRAVAKLPVYETESGYMLTQAELDELNAATYTAAQEGG